MAVFGVGAYYDRDVSQEFINNEIIGVGWNEMDAPELEEYFKNLKVGDIVYLKAAFGGNDITVKAIGIFKDNTIIKNTQLVTTGRNVKWLFTEKFVIKRPQEKRDTLIFLFTQNY